MNAKLKRTLILFLTAALIAAGAVFPRAAALAADRAAAGETGVVPISPVELACTDTSGASVVGKLALLAQAEDFLYMQPSASVRDETAIAEAVPELLAPYAEAGLLPDGAEYYDIGCSLLLYYDSSQPDKIGKSSLIWSVELYLDADRGSNAYLLVDDETGMLLAIGFYYFDSFYNGKAEEYVRTLAQIYLAETGLDALAGAENLETYAGENPLEPDNDDACILQWRIGDAAYGEVAILFSFDGESVLIVSYQ